MASLNVTEQAETRRIVEVSQEFCFGCVKLDMPI